MWNRIRNESCVVLLALTGVGCSSDGSNTSQTGGNVGLGGSTSLGGSRSGGAANGGSSVQSGGASGATSGGTAGQGIGGTTNGGTPTSGGSGGLPTSGGSAGQNNGGAPANGGSGGLPTSGGSAGQNNGGTPASGGAAGSSGSGGTNSGGANSGGAKASGGSAGTGGSGGANSGGAPGTGGSAGKGGSGGGGTTTPGVGFHDTPGGSGGTVIKVTTLAASGAGSLAAAIAATGPRIIVFEVGGIIDLNKARINVNQPFVTIAGQTAPSPGITLIRGGLVVTTHDVKIQHVRVRMGDAGDTASTGFEPDVATDGANAYNITFDHVSVAWGVDENLSVSGPRFDGVNGTSRKVTISNSIIAEGLNDSVHEKGEHSMGTLIHDYCTDVAVVGNFYAHNDERNPWFKAFGRGVVVNNLIYNPGTWAMRLGHVASEWTSSSITPEGPQISVVGNYLQFGTNTPASQVMVGSNSSGAAYMQDNLAFKVGGATAPISGGNVQTLSQRGAWPANLTAMPASQVKDWVLAHAGARPKDRDAVDTRLVADFKAGRGSLVNSQNQVGGYPTATPTTRALTVPTTNVDGWLADMARAVEAD